MPHFYAEFVVGSGKRRKVRLDSVSQAALSDEIETVRKGYVVEIRKIVENRQTSDRIRISSSMLLLAFDSLELMLVSGVRINSAVRTVAECAPSGDARRLWTELVLLIEETGSFGESIGHFPRVFSESMIGILVAHERAGCLADGIVNVRGYIAQMQEIRRESLRGATYPIIICGVAAAAALVLCEFTLPRFSKILTDIGVKKTNRLTEFFFSLSDLVVRHPGCVFLGICMPIILVVAIQRPSVRPIFDRLMLRLPILRSATEALAMARICTTFRALSRSGIKVVDALESCARASGNAVYAEGIGQVVAAVRENLSVGAGFERAGIFAPEFVMAVKSGEASLPCVFGRLAEYYTSECKHRVALALKLVEPIMLILVLAWVFGVTLAVVLPIVDIADGIH